MSRMTAQTFKDINVLLSGTVSISQELLNDILGQINVIDTFIPEREYFWNLQLSGLSSDISKLVEVTTLLSQVIQTRKKSSLPEIKQSHIHLLFIIKGINQAQQKQDALVLEDLIKYELKDNLTQWKIYLIPLIKRLLNS
jgi:hypothetical protein